MNCPACKTVQLVVIEREGVEIDYCPNCRGVWLERNELDTIIKRASEDRVPAQPVQPNYPPPQNTPPYMGGRYDDRRRYDEDDDYKKQKGYYKKKGGFLEDLFDF